MTAVDPGEPFSYEPFTSHAFYTAINQALVQQALERLPAAADHPLRIIDLACGTGAITRLVAEALHKKGCPAQMIAVDRSASALQQAAERLETFPIAFLQGDLTELNQLDSQADVIFFCNAIHLIAEKESLLKSIAQLLAPGGVLACNTTFFDGAYAEGTERCYRLSIRRALEFLRREHPGMRPARQEHATAMQWLTPLEYQGLLENTGFQHVRCSLQQGELPLQAWQDIGSYAGFIEGALPGIPLQVGTQALRVAAAQVFDELALSVIPRNWLQITASRA
ncbi:MAG TPA: class I SAM-dependent methyltransferase [Ktedonobacterales bacterium]|nr:class I SAM-dependent methyltransferase [Ktedonobacterales bacterium]